MTDASRHPQDEQLAALLDGSLRESDAAAHRRHLEMCGPCQQRLSALQTVVRQLKTLPPADHALINQTTQRALREPAPAWSAPLRTTLTALPFAAILVWLVWPTSQAPSEPVARGAQDDALQTVSMRLFHVEPPGSNWRPLATGSRVETAVLALAVAIDFLPAHKPRYVAVYARDGAGRVTWLAPSWTTRETAPGCLQLPAGTGSPPARQAVTLDAVATGQLEVALLVFSQPCQIAQLDDRLERGWMPLAGDAGLHQVERMNMTVGARP